MWTIILAICLGQLSLGHATKITVFGDSLSDIGNSFRDYAFPALPYWNGRWSNGPSWPDYIAKYGNLSVEDYAYAGASSGGTPPGSNFLTIKSAQAASTFIPTLPKQVAAYLSNNSVAAVSSNCSIHIVMVGGNDLSYLAKIPATSVLQQIPLIAGNMTAQVMALARAGAKNIVIGGFPNITYFPAAINISDINLVLAKASLIEIDSQIWAGLGTVAALCNCSLNPLAKIDIDAFTGDTLRNLSTVGNAGQSSCFNPLLYSEGSPAAICNNPEQHVFWDAIHPVTTVHSSLAQYILGIAKESFPWAFEGACQETTGPSAVAIAPHLRFPSPSPSYAAG